MAQIGRSQTTVKRIILYSPAHFTRPFSSRAHQFTKATTKTTTSKDVVWPKPSEIPFQVKVANSVNLIGHVDAPVQFQTSSDGKHWAGTVIVQHAASHSLWIPILFEGDLAHIASSHLKKDDHVHIAGQLTADPPAIEGQANVQVKPRYPDFKRKDGTLPLWLNSAPDWVLSELEGVVFDKSKPVLDDQTRKSNYVKKSKGVVFDKSKPVLDDQTQKSNYVKKSKVDDLWKDLVENPDKWWDNRLDKKSEKGPDFKHKETGKPLWLNYSPAWVTSQLPPVKSTVKSK
ncbi:protein OSB2 [Citrus sinensis]|uniref:Protein OSB2 n=1 Tax=Citrus sinensis TaxID=2711 RepID=A0ACB8NDG6_CITSI|nr:protein OSB2 [Citrus sinensis]